MGSSHAVSNGNDPSCRPTLTRLFSVAVVDLYVLRAGELDQALAIAAQSLPRCVGMPPGPIGSSRTRRPTSWSPGSAWTEPPSGSSNRCRPVLRRPLRASFVDGLPRRWWRPRSGLGVGIRRCRSRAGPPAHPGRDETAPARPVPPARRRRRAPIELTSRPSVNRPAVSIGPGFGAARGRLDVRAATFLRIASASGSGRRTAVGRAVGGQVGGEGSLESRPRRARLRRARDTATSPSAINLHLGLTFHP